MYKDKYEVNNDNTKGAKKLSLAIRSLDWVLVCNY